MINPFDKMFQLDKPLNDELLEAAGKAVERQKEMKKWTEEQWEEWARRLAKDMVRADKLEDKTRAVIEKQKRILY